MKKLLKRAVLNLVIVLAAFIGAGIIADWLYSGWLARNEVSFSQTFDCQSPSGTPAGGFKPNCKGRWIKKFGEESFDIEFTTDQFGRRIVFDKIKKSPSDAGQVFFFGGSDVLGKGVNDKDTIANQFLNLSDFVKARNFGGNGSGPQQALELLLLTDLPKEAPPDPDRNVMLFFFGDDHVNRAEGSWSIATEWGAEFPYYVLDEHDQLVSRGSFASGKRYSSIQLLAKKSRLLDDLASYASSFFGFSDSDIRLTAKMFAAMEEKFYSQYKNAHFYVVLSPITTRSSAKLKEYLKEFGVDFLDYSKVWDPHNEDNWLPEGHPSPEIYKKVAEQLAKDLKR